MVCPLEDEYRKYISRFMVGSWYVRSKMSVGNLFPFHCWVVVCPLEDECRKSISRFMGGSWFVRWKMSVGNLIHVSWVGRGLSVGR